MRILLLSMPDSFEHTPSLTMRMPNGALASLAGNVGPGHTGRDRRPDPRAAFGRSDRRTAPARPRARRRRAVDHDLPAPHRAAIDPPHAGHQARRDGGRGRLRPEPGARGVRAAVERRRLHRSRRGRAAFRALLRALSRGEDREGSRASRRGPGRRRRRLRPRAAPAGRGDRDGELALPDRGARVLDGYTFLGRPIDIVETSRGCTYDCSFCSIIEMRGRNFHTFDFTRVLADIADARGRGARAIFLVDDNITLNVGRFEALCRAIVEAGLNDIHYIVQAMTSSIASHGETLAPLMRRAGFRYVFLGIENVLDEDLAFLRASAKNAEREGGRRTGNATARRHRRSCTAPVWPSSAASSSGIPTTRASRSRPTSRSRGATWTGRTSSIRRRIPGRR